ncbi:RND transporter [Metaplanococcus flavidus]|uniref:RND transporter n=1 Tax=Metaplanococcus flavidus TaxID=569883 RepID=A0ABW3LFP6_9BACL
MKNESNVRTINRVILAIVLVLGLGTALFTIVDLISTADTAFGEEAQSRYEFGWGLSQTTVLIALAAILILLVIGWNRIFPFNVPLAVILFGFCYQFFFLVFTVGWVGFQGLVGLLAALFLGIILSVIYAISILSGRRRTVNR